MKFVTTQGLVRSDQVFETDGKTPVKAMVKHNGRERLINVYDHKTHNAGEVIELIDEDEITDLLKRKVIRRYDEALDGGMSEEDIVARDLEAEKVGDSDPLK